MTRSSNLSYLVKPQNGPNQGRYVHELKNRQKHLQDNCASFAFAAPHTHSLDANNGIRKLVRIVGRMVERVVERTPLKGRRLLLLPLLLLLLYITNRDEENIHEGGCRSGSGSGRTVSRRSVHVNAPENDSEERGIDGKVFQSIEYVDQTKSRRVIHMLMSTLNLKPIFVSSKVVYGLYDNKNYSKFSKFCYSKNRKKKGVVILSNMFIPNSKFLVLDKTDNEIYDYANNKKGKMCEDLEKEALFIHSFDDISSKSLKKPYFVYEKDIDISLTEKQLNFIILSCNNKIKNAFKIEFRNGSGFINDHFSCEEQGKIRHNFLSCVTIDFILDVGSLMYEHAYSCSLEPSPVHAILLFSAVLVYRNCKKLLKEKKNLEEKTTVLFDSFLHFTHLFVHFCNLYILILPSIPIQTDAYFTVSNPLLNPSLKKNPISCYPPLFALTLNPEHIYDEPLEGTSAVIILSETLRFLGFTIKWGIHENGYWLTNLNYSFDYILSNLIIKYFKEKSNEHKVKTVLDMGCGYGYYVNELNFHKIRAVGVDGNVKLVHSLKNENLYTLDVTSDQFVPDLLRQVNDSRKKEREKGDYLLKNRAIKRDGDLTKNILTFDYALCLNVGEYIPKKKEESFFRNLDKMNSKGVIISWDLPNSFNIGTINEKNGEELLDVFLNNYSYSYDEKNSKMLRDNCSNSSLKNCIYIFEKKK
ncbi:hypothetical protein POVCU2_0009780 [Plasmodium ovale curtisi]|uniref:Methyltransferase n=1 Tax=Plasmodium ovale curtisi TaxID=864141 RepID=A0A1A8VL66_PLAOA|nr:hypothetical protein POVCU2_0009780 [Plasmodium ovale curtisi]